MWRFNCFPQEKSENKEILERASAVLTRAGLIDIESALVSKRWLYLRPLAHFWTQSCGRVKVIRIRQCGWISISQQACGLLDQVGDHIFFSLSIAFYFVYSQVHENEHFSAGLWSRGLDESSYFHFTLTFFFFPVIYNQIQKKNEINFSQPACQVGPGGSEQAVARAVGWAEKVRTKRLFRRRGLSFSSQPSCWASSSFLTFMPKLKCSSRVVWAGKVGTKLFFRKRFITHFHAS